MCSETGTARSSIGSFGNVSPPPTTINCVHCKKSFPMSVVGADTRHEGYKCPHCKLYMPLARAVQAAGSAA